MSRHATVITNIVPSDNQPTAMSQMMMKEAQDASQASGMCFYIYSNNYLWLDSQNIQHDMPRHGLDVSPLGMEKAAEGEQGKSMGLRWGLELWYVFFFVFFTYINIYLP